VLSADEKTSIQAHLRRHATQPSQPGRPMAVICGRFLPRAPRSLGSHQNFRGHIDCQLLEAAGHALHSAAHGMTAAREIRHRVSDARAGGSGGARRPPNARWRARGSEPRENDTGAGGNL
jgi:hypothetical protein